MTMEIKRWGLYQHVESGKKYMVVCVSNLHADRDGWIPTVTYQDMDGLIWSRPMAEFRDRFKVWENGMQHESDHQVD